MGGWVDGWMRCYLFAGPLGVGILGWVECNVECFLDFSFFLKLRDWRRCFRALRDFSGGGASRAVPQAELGKQER